MAILVAPDCVRLAFNGDYLGRPNVNILDMVCEDNSSGTLTRQDNIDAMLETVFNAWNAFVGIMSTAYSVSSIGWVDLNSETGATGTKTSSASHSWPVSGGEAGNPYSGNTTLLVTKVTNSGRGSRNGRWYLASLTESNVTGNVVTSSHLSDAQGSLSTFLEAATETGELATTHYFPTVIHTKNEGTPTAPDIVYVGNSQIHNMVPQPTVASQRRRVRP